MSSPSVVEKESTKKLFIYILSILDTFDNRKKIFSDKTSIELGQNKSSMEPIKNVCDMVTIIFMEDISSLFAPSPHNAEVSEVSLMLYTLITLIQTQQTIKYHLYHESIVHKCTCI